jgi:hypothetical protein
LEGRNQLGNIGIDRKIIIELILKKKCMNSWAGFYWLRIRTSSGICDHGNGPSGFINAGN